MYHLFPSVVEIIAPISDIVDGTLVQTWQKVNATFDSKLGSPGEMKCRLDLQYLRPGKDAPQPIQAGVAPDRVGLLFCLPSLELKAGQVLKCVSGPVMGTFMLKAVPDIAVGFGAAHHIECQVYEIGQNTVNFPSSPAE